MKNLKKFVAAFAAAAMVMSMGVSALAEVVVPAAVEEDDQLTGFTFVIDGTDISVSDEDYITLMAYLIPAENEDGEAYTAETIPAYSNQTIVALDQVGGAEGFGEVPVDVEKLAGGEAIAIKLGNSAGDIAQGIIIYNVETGEVKILIGDVNEDGLVNGDDKLLLSAYCGAGDKAAFNTGNNKKIGTAVATGYLIGDVNGDTLVNGDDKLLLSAYCGAGDKAAFNTGNNKQIGIEITIK